VILCFAERTRGTTTDSKKFDKLFMMVLEVGQSIKKGYFGKECMHEESDTWKEEKQACMHGRPNVVRVMIFAIHFNGCRARNV
jgi:hypothetical protein